MKCGLEEPSSFQLIGGLHEKLETRETRLQRARWRSMLDRLTRVECPLFHEPGRNGSVTERLLAVKPWPIRTPLLLTRNLALNYVVLNFIHRMIIPTKTDTNKQTKRTDKERKKQTNTHTRFLFNKLFLRCFRTSFSPLIVHSLFSKLLSLCQFVEKSLSCSN